MNEKKIKGVRRPRHYMNWGDPEEEEVLVPRKTLCRLGLQPANTSDKQVECPRSIHSNQDGCGASLSPEAADAADIQHDQPEISNIDNMFQDETSCSSLASTERLSRSISGEEDSISEEYRIDSPINSCDDEPEQNLVHYVPEDDQLVNLRAIFVEERQEDQTAAATSSEPNTLTFNKPAYESTLRKLMSDKFSSVVSENSCLSPREILFNILNLAESHDVNNSLFVGICKLVNSMYSEPVLPDTQYKLDELLLSTCGVKYHFYCSKCLELLKIKEFSEPLICKCGCVNTISDLTKASFFISYDICTQLDIALRNPEVANELLDLNLYQNDSLGMHDLYDGEVYTQFRHSLDFNDGATHLSFTLCADGSPLYKSSNADIWPLLATLNELPPLKRMKRPLLLGLWFGKGKPKFESFFGPIFQQVRHLSEQGAIINVGGKQTFIKVDVIGCCVDAAVRGPIQGIHLHNGIYGCNWCLHPGTLEGQGSNARKYQYFENPPALRTHAEIVDDAEAARNQPVRAPSASRPHVNGVVESSPLLKLPHIDIVSGIILDSMHNVFLGTTRQFLRLWFGVEGNVKLPDNTFPAYYVGSPTMQDRVNKKIALLTPPIETRRLPRPISDLVHFKSRELENFLFYFLVPVLRGILPEHFLRHFILYIQGMYLLMKDIVLPEDLTASETLLKEFVKEIEKLYKNLNFSQYKLYTYNVHITLHAVDNVRRWGPLWSVSGYAYENGIGDLKATVHANRGIPDQVSRALCKSNVKELLSQEIKSARCASFLNEITPNKRVNISFVQDVKVFGLTSEDFHPSPEEEFLLNESALNVEDFSEAKKIVYKKCLFAPSLKTLKTRNDFAQLKDGRIVQIKKIIVNEELLQCVLVFCSIVHVSPSPVHVSSQVSLTSPFMFDVELIECEQHLISHSLLAKPCVYSNLKSLGGIETVSVMANVINEF